MTTGTTTKGRNMGAATVVGLILFVVVVGTAYFAPLAFTIIIYLICLAALPEWKRALARQGRVISLVPISAATIGMGVSVWFDGREGLIIALLVGAGGTIAWRLVDEWVEDSLHDALADVLTLVWIPFFASFVALLVQSDDGWIRVFILVAALTGNDTGALFVGMLIGRHKLAPRISPKKTWEGAIGGIVIGTGLAAVVSYRFLEEDWRMGVVVGFAVTIAAIFGDLVESALKRDIAIKDMSSLLPGHGGVLDRMDSALFAGPVAYVIFALFLGTL
ncbi:MAG: phosphatidate cytidylyltransferase [Demequinaceae bacterium]|nr:phosphatidate cytidylyltransferase [Demequinaceae bacterium]